MDAYSLLLGKMPKEELEARIKSKMDEMSGFLTREAAVRIIANETGAGAGEKARLADIEDGANRGIVVAKVARILALQRFENGKRMRKIVLSDESGERELKLWNEDCAITDKLHAGDVVEASGIYCKNNELSLGYSGEMKVVEKASFADLGALVELEGMDVNVRGYVESLDEMKKFERNGETREMASFTVADGKNRSRVIIWDNPARGKDLPIGAEVKIENARVKNGELHMGVASRLLVKRKKEGIHGKIEHIGVQEGKLLLEIDGKKHEFAREDALRVLGAEVAEDITLETVVELKKKEFLGKEIFIEMKGEKIGSVSLKD